MSDWTEWRCLQIHHWPSGTSDVACQLAQNLPRPAQTVNLPKSGAWLVKQFSADVVKVVCGCVGAGMGRGVEMVWLDRGVRGVILSCRGPKGLD